MATKKWLLVTIISVALIVGAYIWTFRSPDLSCRECNIILVSIDTLRADHLGCYGYSRPTSPNVDRFCTESVKYDQAIAQAPSTTPSHGSILTSMIPSSHGAFRTRKRKLSPAVLTMAEILQGEGFRTASFNGGAQLDAKFGFDRGFEVYQSMTGDALDNDDFTLQVDKGIDWIKQHRDQRFFLFLHSYDIHHPYHPTPEDLTLFSASYSGPLSIPINATVLSKINHKELDMSEADRQFIIDAYDGEIKGMDAGFGRLLEFLAAAGLKDDTILIFTSDHGEEFGEHGKMGWHSHTLFDELLHVPLIIRFPRGQFAGTSIPAQVRSIDILPTALELLGVKRDPSFQGLSLIPLVTGEQQTLDDDRAISQRDSSRPVPPTSLRRTKWKYHRKKLYDLAADPAEKVDVSGQHPEILAKMRSEIEDALKDSGSTTSEEAVLDSSLTEQLRTLGYTR